MPGTKPDVAADALLKAGKPKAPGIEVVNITGEELAPLFVSAQWMK
jgi:hypothetical protein